MTGKLLLVFIIYHVMSTVGFINKHISTDPSDIEKASNDFGGMIQTKPLGVLYPNSASDVASLVKSIYNSMEGYTVSARGNGHSINGQAQTANGVVIEMSRLRSKKKLLPLPSISIQRNNSSYVDVWGGELWIDVLNWCLKYGLAPKSWTDYLYLSVGGTLSNAGVSGQAYIYGPQINNVYELDVVTGKGELLTCSKHQNYELFHAVLGGLGQFGIITRARIALEKAPQRVKWIRVFYNDFLAFTKDQEYLISLHAASDRFDYVEGYVVVDDQEDNNVVGSVRYCLEIVKNYDDSTANTIDQQVQNLLETLNFIQSSILTSDVSYVDFLDHVHKVELNLRSKNLWDVPHPWLNLFVPKSKIVDFDKGVFKGILGNKTTGLIIIYPMNKNKWDDQNTVVTPNEEVFYYVGFLQSAATSDSGESLKYLNDRNQQILQFCDKEGIKIKHYLPNHSSQEAWKAHFEDKWGLILERKMKYDPKHILATGQHMFKPPLACLDYFPTY